jgi:hypothetical protein
VRPPLTAIGDRYRELGARLSRRHTLGPFLFCDYWASVLPLRSILNPVILTRGLVSPDIFRQALDRPKTKVPRLRYYLVAFLLGPWFLPYRIAFNLAMLLRPKSREKIVGQADLLHDDYRVELHPGDDPRWVHASIAGEGLATPVLNPDFAPVENGLFFPTYKIVVAAILTVLLSCVAIPALREGHGMAWLLPYFGVLTYPVLVVLLLLLVRDSLAALVAPLPVFAAVALLSLQHSPWQFVAGMAGAGVLLFLVECLMIPRGLPPALYLYVNEPGHPLHPYAKGHAPWWLEGKTYWVWRFVSLAPAEIHKFWEKDWERTEIWVRADPGPDAGRLEWMVTDVHYREIWFSYDRLVPAAARARHEAKRRLSLERNGEPIVWVVETDMHIITHTPEVRGVFLTTTQPPLRDRTLPRILRTLVGPRPRDDHRRYLPEVERIEVAHGEFLNDLSDLVRGATTRMLLRLPWSYWRYPRGVRSAPRRYLYDADRLSPAEPAAAADPRYQVKALVEGAAPASAGGRRGRAAGA